MGNICRSPAAEGVFRNLVADAGRAADFEIDSAGTISYHSGDPADSRMRAAASRRGYQLDSRARRIHRDDFDRFDLIVTMDDENFETVRSIDPGRKARIVRMCDFVSDCGATEVPDPYYGGEEGFEEVLDILEESCANLLARVHGQD
jgi:protein-tyrosine phosphatase